MNDLLLLPGDVVLVGRSASVQFRAPITFRVIGVIGEWVTYDRWTWLRGYQLDERGDAVARRDIFVQPAGLRLLRRAATAPPPTRRRPNQRPVHPRPVGTMASATAAQPGSAAGGGSK